MPVLVEPKHSTYQDLLDYLEDHEEEIAEGRIDLYNLFLEIMNREPKGRFLKR